MGGGRPGRAATEQVASEGTRSSHLSAQGVQGGLRGMASGTDNQVFQRPHARDHAIPLTNHVPPSQQTRRWTVGSNPIRDQNP